jgi:hypothetical protein
MILIKFSINNDSDLSGFLRLLIVKISLELNMRNIFVIFFIDSRGYEKFPSIVQNNPMMIIEKVDSKTITFTISSLIT